MPSSASVPAPEVRVDQHARSRSTSGGLAAAGAADSDRRQASSSAPSGTPARRFRTAPFASGLRADGDHNRIGNARQAEKPMTKPCTISSATVEHQQLLWLQGCRATMSVGLSAMDGDNTWRCW